MTEPAENYTPVDVQLRFRAQAIRVWAVTSTIVFIWALLIVVPAILAANGQQGFAAPLYTFFSAICHQMEDRTFHFDGHPFAVCSRCFGVYFGLLVGLLIYPLWRRIDDIEPLPRKWLILSIVPMGIDWSLTIFDIWENTFATRFITGLVLGIACATYIIPALVEIFRNFTFSRRSKG